MWSGAGTPIGIVAKLMDMHAAFRRRIAAFDIIGDSS